MDLKAKNIVITGGTLGIGLEMVKQLYPNNNLLVIASNGERLGALMETFPKIKIQQLDLSQLSQLTEGAEKIIEQMPQVDLLINNAAVQYTPQFLDAQFEYENIAREVTINFTSLCCLCHLLLPSMQKQSRSVILNINSGLALAAKKSSAIYCATNGAMNLFSQSLGYQLEGSNIKVLQAFLPLVETGMTKGRGQGKLTAPVAAKAILQGLKKEKKEINIGKVKLLRWILRISPTLGHKILKGS